MKYTIVADADRSREAHGAFLAEGQPQPGMVPDFISSSWTRCHSAGVAADRVRELARLSSQQMREAGDAHLDLVAEAAPVIENLYQEVVGTGNIVLLCAPDGLILQAMGDPEFLARADRVALSPGVRWAEEEKGTNAIGTAIVERAPVMVYGAQHYVRSHHFLTCSAAPIIDPFGGIAGVLDVTGDYRAHQPHTLALVKMATQVIQRQLFRRRFRQEAVLRFHTRPNYIGSIYDGQMAFRMDGTCVTANGIARDALRRHGVGVTTEGERDGATTATRFEDLFGIGLGDALARIRCGDGVAQLELHDGTSVFAQVDSLPPGTGAANAMTSRRRVAPAARAMAAAVVQPADAPATPLDALDLGDGEVRAVVARARRVLGRNIPLLVEGETGTGKEWLARAIHGSGPRASGEFVAVNCAAIPEGLIESELFGYDEGAFTGARRKGQPGRILQADGGTLFLDEIGDMPLQLQTRLLRVLQDRVVTPLGATRPRTVDIAVICATHRNIRALVANGQFREDLYYRLNGLTLRLPPLRDRSDLRALVARILADECEPVMPVPEVEDEVWTLFETHPWPGNIRQLQSVLRTAVALMGDDESLRVDHLPEGFADGLPLQRPPSRFEPAVPREAAPDPVSAAAAASPLSGPLAEIQTRIVRETLDACGGNVSEAARKLGISRNTLYRKLRGQ